MRAGREEKKPEKKNRTLKLLLILIAVLIIAIVAASAWLYKSAEDSLNVSFTADRPSVEVGGDYPSMDYVKDSEGEVTPSANVLDADTIGDKKIVYTASASVLGGLLKPEKEFTLNYTVIDTTDPVRLWSGDGTVLERGTEFDINKVIGYGDNADPRPSLKVDGEVDTNKNGTYPLHVTVTDASGNSVDWDLNVKVADSLPVYTDDSPRTDFRDFAEKYKKDDNTCGIDVSVWQGDIDFEEVKKAGCDFVIIRAGYSVDGEVEPDSKFDDNFRKARAAGLRVGVYLYSYDNNEKDVRASAKWIVDKLGGEKLDLPVAFDWEDFSKFQTYEMSFRDLNKLYDAFADELSLAGYNCMLYGSKVPLETLWEDTDRRTVWLAHYTDKTDYKGPYRIWQASQTGNISGISGDVDMDILYN